MRYLITLLFCFVAKTMFAQSSSSSLLWEISGKHLKKPSYLYGTMHVQDKRVFQFGDSVMITFNTCKAFAGELDLKMDGNDVAKIFKLSMMPGDTTLSMLLSKEDYEFAKKELKKKLGNQVMVVDKMKPMLTSALLTEESIRKDSSEFLDQYLRNKAKGKGMKTLGLETMEEQMNAIDRITLKEQADLLVSSLKDQKKADDELNKMFEYYLAQDLDGIERYVREYEMPDEFSKSVLIKRNYVMADRIPKLVDKQPTFIAIGAAHLPGNEGVIELLRKKGYRVRPVVSKMPVAIKDSIISKPVVPHGWSVYRSGNLEISFPSEPKVNEESDQKITTAYALEPNTDNLYSLTFHSKIRRDQPAADYFKEVIDSYAGAKSKITSQRESTMLGFPCLELEVTEGISTIRMKHIFMADKVAELAVTADKEEVKAKNSELFFNSFRILK